MEASPRAATSAALADEETSATLFTGQSVGATPAEDDARGTPRLDVNFDDSFPKLDLGLSLIHI